MGLTSSCHCRDPSCQLSHILSPEHVSFRKDWFLLHFRNKYVVVSLHSDIKKHPTSSEFKLKWEFKVFCQLGPILSVAVQWAVGQDSI